mmetsp:Transcript_11384/g.26749  ORF Transcript_11384/g.26749 Transcript_11384/m.26749 type:complete len:267 (+) Transcript_11384:514-1314(+)
MPPGGICIMPMPPGIPPGIIPGIIPPPIMGCMPGCMPGCIPGCIPGCMPGIMPIWNCAKLGIPMCIPGNCPMPGPICPMGPMCWNGMLPIPCMPPIGGCGKEPAAEKLLLRGCLSLSSRPLSTLDPSPRGERERRRSSPLRSSLPLSSRLSLRLSRRSSLPLSSRLSSRLGGDRRRSRSSMRRRSSGLSAFGGGFAASCSRLIRVIVRSSSSPVMIPTIFPMTAESSSAWIMSNSSSPSLSSGFGGLAFSRAFLRTSLLLLTKSSR